MKGWRYVLDDNVSAADLHTFFMGTVVLYNNRPTKVQRVTDAKIFRLLDLETQKVSTVPMAHRAITSPTRRLGMINIDCCAVYMKRIPYRKYQIGISHNNVSVSRLPLDMRDESENAINKLRNMEHPSLAECMYDKYPSFSEAFNSALEFNGAFAFDKQFAVCCDGNIFYKDKKAGRLTTAKNPAIKDIAWESRYRYLTLLLEGNYEKSIRDFGPTLSC
jgi:hypothetical protein